MNRQKNIKYLIQAIFPIFLLLVAFSLWAVPVAVYASAITSQKVIELTNIDRQRAKLSLLETNDTLTRAAEMKAADMAAKGYFSHTSPEGTSPWHWFDQAGYAYRYAGENLAIRFTNAEEEQQAWMNSSSHRANILNAKYHEIGVAVQSEMQDGRPVLVVVQLFGTRQNVAASALVDQLQPAVQAVATQQPEQLAGQVSQLRTPEGQVVFVPSAMSTDTSGIFARLEKYGLDPVQLALLFLVGILELMSALIVGKIWHRRSFSSKFQNASKI